MVASYVFVGIGGSGMMPLAEIVLARGDRVAGSDRALDQRRTEPKFDLLRAKGAGLFAQDGSAVTSTDQIVVTSAAIEDDIPDVVRATALGCRRMTRAALLAELFNAAPGRIAVGGTSGKSTVTGMAGFMLAAAGRDPTVMNGAIIKDFGSGARVGAGDVFVTEVDESDGSIALFDPQVAVLTNVSIDHKSLDELRALFGEFAARAEALVVNLDNAEAAALAASHPGRIGFSLTTPTDIYASDIVDLIDGTRFTLHVDGATHAAALAVPGRHNVANALAAIGAVRAVGADVAVAVASLARFSGLRRRLETVGEGGGVTVIDDFGHNPDKIAATLAALHAFPGRLLVFFQPHGYGPLKQMGRELAYTFRANLAEGDRLIVCDPVYFGGTVDRSVGSEALVASIGEAAEHIAAREACGERLLAIARPGDRIVVMGARDDTLSGFARGLVEGLGAKAVGAG